MIIKCKLDKYRLMALDAWSWCRPYVINSYCSCYYTDIEDSMIDRKTPVGTLRISWCVMFILFLAYYHVK